MFAIFLDPTYQLGTKKSIVLHEKYISLTHIWMMKLWMNSTGCWDKWIKQQDTHEDYGEVDEG